MATDSVALTQLKVHEKLHHSHNEKEIKTERPTSLGSKQIYLGNFMMEMEAKNHYEHNHRMLAFLPLTIWMLASWGFFAIDNDVGAIVNICFFSLILFFCVVIIIHSKYSGLSLKIITNKWLGLQNISYSGEFEFTFTPYAGLFFLCIIMYTACVSILHDATSAKSWAINMMVLARAMPLSVNLLLVSFYYRRLSNNTSDKIMEFKQSVTAKHQDDRTMIQLRKRIDEALKMWKKRQHFRNRKVEYVLSFIVIFVMNYITNAIYYWRMYEKPPLEFIVETIIFVSDACVCASVILLVHTLYLYYQLGVVIMTQFGYSLNATSINELIGWWELRKFYTNCVVKQYLSLLGISIGGLLIICITIIGFTFRELVIDFSSKSSIQGPEVVTLVVYCVYVIVMTLLIISNATKYHNLQLSHAQMINKESMALNIYNLDSNDEYELKDRPYLLEKIVDKMTHDIEHNSHAMKALGFSLNSKFMLLMRASTGSLMIATLSLIMKNNN